MSNFLNNFKKIFSEYFSREFSKNKMVKVEKTPPESPGEEGLNVSPTMPEEQQKTEITAKKIEDEILWKELPSENYFKQEFTKEIIVLHFTLGNTWKGAYDTFLKNPPIATPFIVDKEGPKYFVQLFDEKYWAYHLGIVKAEHNRNRINDKRSIAIEIVNMGPVWFRDGVWKDAYGGSWNPDNVVRGKNKDADGAIKFSDEQVEAVCRLVNYLCDKWGISRQVPKDKMSFQLPQIGQFKGITTHEMFRENGKYDMGVAWPWEKMMEKCNLKEV